jgi:phosphate transport system substrate-binding protein
MSTDMKTKIVLGLSLGVLLLAGSCRDKDKSGKPLDTVSSGSITIAVDESLRPIMDAEVDSFTKIYTNAHIKIVYLPEEEAIHAMLKDSARLAIVTRKLTAEETKVLESQKLVPRHITVAHDAVALILNKAKVDTLFETQQFTRIATGEISNWNQINKKLKPESIDVVFDSPKSGIIRLVRDSIARIPKLPSNFYAVEGNQAVIDYVSKKPNAMGLIGVSWISDHDDSTANHFLNTVRVVSFSSDSSYYRPFPAYVALKQYPFLRDVIIISREARTGLGSGFATFVANEKGQRIILKAGMVPAKMPVRIVEVTNNF